MADLDLQLEEMTNKLNHIQAVKQKRDNIKNSITMYSQVYNPTAGLVMMGNPLESLNFVLSSEQIQKLSELVIIELTTELAKVEEELTALLV